MLYALLADATVTLHFAFILFVLFGGLLVLWKPRVIWVHLPVALYGVLIEWIGWVCPLTPLENHFRRQAGEAGYAGGFIDQYLLAIIYPDGVTDTMMILLGAGVVLANILVYGFVWHRRRAAEGSSDEAA
jgi:hypothetical protein